MFNSVSQGDPGERSQAHWASSYTYIIEYVYRHMNVYRYIIEYVY